MSCGTCHRPELGWTDGRSRPIQDDGQTMALRTPSLVNDAWTLLLGWDGRFPNLEAVPHAVITEGEA
jgi:cytochrome c peroxidase